MSDTASDTRWPLITRGFVVAGGRSSRMGRDKALLPYGESTLLEHAIAQTRRVTDDVAILAGPVRRYEDFGPPVVEDVVCGVGPLGGLYSALLTASADGRERIFWLAVDLPFVPAEFLSRLVSELDQADVAMARTERGLEPLCAAFRTEPTLARVRKALLDGELKLTAAFDGLLLQSIDATPAVFLNVNTFGDYKRLGLG
jgi:molybdopterin-guanine dinucleotide biosynthesis protein A